MGKKWRSTLRWSPDNYDWLCKESARLGIPIAQVANLKIAELRQQDSSKQTAVVASK